jgi:superfamily II DNA or RNA helicase
MITGYRVFSLKSGGRIQEAGRAYPSFIGIVNNSVRNTFIVDSAIHFLNLNKSIFIIINRIAHGELLRELFKKVGYSVPFISGQENPEYIYSTLKDFENKNLKCIVSSSISDEGLSLPAIDVLILGVGNKSALKTIQRVGRGLRKKLVGENSVTIIDFIDRGSKYLYKHSVERCRVYIKLGIDIYEVLDSTWTRVEKR